MVSTEDNHSAGKNVETLNRYRQSSTRLRLKKRANIFESIAGSVDSTSISNSKTPATCSKNRPSQIMI